MDAQARRRARAQFHRDRREFRPTAERAGELSRHRPRHHRASRHQPAANRQYAVRRVRSASGLRHLQRHQPVPRGDGNRPALHAVSQFAARRLRVALRRHASRNCDNQCAGGSGHGGDREWDRGNSACLLHSLRSPRPPRPLRPIRRPARARPASTTSSASGTSGATATSATSSSTSAATSASALAARNAFTNALANTGHGPTSAGAAVSTTVETMIPLAAVSHYRPGHTPLSVNHQGLFVASTISFNLQPGKSLGRHRPKSMPPSRASICPHRYAAFSPARRSCSSSRSARNRS